MSALSLFLESFTYRPSGWLARLNPWSKLALFLVAIALTFLVGSWKLESMLFAAFILISASSGILNKMAGALVSGVAFSVFLFLLNVLSGSSFVSSLVSALKFANFMQYSSLFFKVTPPEEIEYVLSFFSLPSEVSFMITAAMRFVPVVLRDAMQVYDAQRARGLMLSKNPIKLFKSLIPLLIPLIITSVRRSESLAEAMETRGYARPRNFRADGYAFRLQDYVFISSITCFGVLIATLNFFAL